METFKRMSEAQQPASAATADPPLPPPADLPPLSANNNNFIPDTVAGVVPSPARCSPSIPSSSGGNNNTVQPCTKHPADPPPLPANDAQVAADAPPPASAAAADAPLPSSKNIDIFMTSISEFLSGASNEPPSDPMKLLAKRCKLPNNWGVYRGGGGRAGKGVFSSLIIRDENKKEIKKEDIPKRVGSNTDFDLLPALKELESINSTINNSLNDKFALGKKMLGIDKVALQSSDGWYLRIWSLNGEASHFRSYQSFYASLDVDDLPVDLIPIRNIECDHTQDELKLADDLGLNLMNNSKISAWTAKKAQVSHLKGSKKFVSPTGIVYTNKSDAWYAAGFRRKCLIYNIKQILDFGFSLKHVHNHMKQFLSPDTFVTVKSLEHYLRGSNAVSNWIFQVHLFQNDDDALRVLLRSTAQPHSSLKGNPYIAPKADETEEAIIERRLANLKRNFIWDEAHLPDEEKEAEEAEEMTAKKKKFIWDEAHLPDEEKEAEEAEEMTAKKKKKKAIPSTHSQPPQKKRRTQQRRKKKSRQPQWSDEEDCEEDYEDYEDGEVVPRSTILRSAKKEEVDYKEKEEKDDDDDCESEDEGKEKDDEDAGHLESDCESEDEGKEKEEKDDDDVGHLESDCESEDEDKTLKQNLIRQLSMMNVRLAPSNIDGIGVFAAVDIPEGITLFSTCNCNQDTSDQTIPLSADEVDSLPSFPQKMVKNFLLPDDSGMRHIPATGLHGLLGQSMYMNSSYGLASRTNVAQDTSVDAVGSYGYTVFKTTKEVMEGEELLWSYKYPGCFKGKQGKFYYMNNNQGEQWMDGTIDEYFTKDERNAMAVKEGKDPTNKHKRGMYKFTLDFDGEEDYFSDEDETVEIDGMTGAQLWKEY